MNVKDLAKKIMELSVAEKAELVSVLRVEYGVEATRAPQHFIPEDTVTKPRREKPAQPTSEDGLRRMMSKAPPVRQASLWDGALRETPYCHHPYEVWMNGYDHNYKINVVKAVMMRCNLTLKAAKLATESSDGKPTLLCSCADRSDALSIIQELENVGGHAYLKNKS